MRLLPRALLLCIPVALAAISTASGQGPAYVAQPPSKGAQDRDGQTGRYLLGGTWLYRADPGDAGVAQGWWGNVAATDGWSPVAIPNAFNAGDFSSASALGSVGWYRRDFVLPSGAFAPALAPRDRFWMIRFESVNYRATVWLNGRLIGSHAGTSLPFEFDLRGLRPGVNRLLVRVDSRRSPSDLPPGPNGGWWNFGGILREVYLRAVQTADLARVRVRPLLPCPRCPASVEEVAQVRNLTGAPQAVRLRGLYGSTPVDLGEATLGPWGTWTARAQVVIPDPQLWSPDHPVLYRAKLSLADAQGRPLSGYVTYSGVRSITVTRGGRLELNGRPVRLRGVELREQNVKTGAALSADQLTQLVGWAKTLGATVIRSDPLDPQLAEMADRDGLLIWSEIPVSGLVGDTYLAQRAWRSRADALLADNIAANENHPSVFLWSIGNELATPATSAEGAYIASAAGLAHHLDPTRPVGIATQGWPGLPCQSAYAPLDVIGLNEYFGWYDSGGGETDDRDALGRFLDSLRRCYPNKAILVSEFGFESNRNGPVEERGTYQFQREAAAYHLRVFASKPWLSGAIYFLLQDAAVSPGFGGGDPWPQPPFVQKGLLDLQGNQKPAFATVSWIYHAAPQIGR